MNTKIIGLCLILIVPVAGCTLDAPCETDEIYINGSCVKCYNHPNHHLNDDGMCVPDTTEACGAGMQNCTGIGIKNSACVNGTCQIYSCMNGYELRSHDDNVLNCEPCGKSEIFYNGACVECNDYPNYHVNDAGQCVPDTNEECGAGKQRCMAEGILSGICVNGSCQINSCKEQYREVMSDGVIVGCESLEAARCGLNSVNCFEKYASVYKEGDWLEASVIGCRRDENQCAVDSCLKGFKRVTCDDYVKYFSQLFDGEMITGCDENWLESVCIPDTCSSISDIGDADHDGIFNCMDPCPNNPTKWNREKWWDNSSNTGIRCDVFDTDHDGVDDEEDECPTNPNLTKAPWEDRHRTCNTILPAEQFSRDRDHLFADANDDAFLKTACEDLYRDWNHEVDDSLQVLHDPTRCLYYHKHNLIDRIEWECKNISANDYNELVILMDRMCSDFIIEYHIYNAQDLDNLRKLLYDRYQSRLCNEDFDRCGDSGRFRTVCKKDHQMVTYACSSCSQDSNDEDEDWDRDENNCTDQTPILDLKIILENDINIDDLNHTVFSDSNQCLNYKWEAIPSLSSVEFNGNNHTISYSRTNQNNLQDSMSCYIIDALFDNISFSVVKNLKLDLDMNGKGHAIFANSIDSSSLNNIEILKANVEINNNLMDFSDVGALTGTYSHVYSFDNQFNDISIHNISINAANYDYIGALMGRLDDAFSRCDNYHQSNIFVNGHNKTGGIIGAITDQGGINCSTIKARNVDTSGWDDVGGLFGISYLENNTHIEAAIHSVSGKSNVGGLFGHLKVRNDVSDGIIIHSVIDKVSANSSVGGFAAEFEAGEMQNVIITNRVGAVSGEREVAGFAKTLKLPWNPQTLLMGNVSDISIYNIVDSVQGDKVAGFFTNLNRDIHLSGIYNQVAEISGKEEVGGFFGGEIWCTEKMIFKNIRNYIGTINGSDTVGGFAGIMSPDDLTSPEIQFEIQNIDSQIDAIRKNGTTITDMIGSGAEYVTISNVYSRVGNEIFAAPNNLTLDTLHKSMPPIDEDLVECLTRSSADAYEAWQQCFNNE